MFNRIAQLFLICAFVFGTAPARAQALAPFTDAGAVETRAMVGITIPLGSRSKSVEAKPRFDLTLERAQFRQGVDGFNQNISIRPERRNVRSTKLSLTLEEQPRFLLNGLAFQSDYSLHADEDEEGAQEDGEDKKSGRSTGKKVLRGAAVAGGVFVTVIAVGFTAFLIECRNDEEGCGE
ncbi:MAG: hypothetical protein QNI87_08645 [Erythrobacter sp.]|uniref:hypothetical protein n=1 Tax=Erythrobacter sp. TaxID=1042 RepID=UPI002603078D|nr:hypothetical protein [Erythrobacter sp.]MDJ0978592.1 hypothetical protein [Erythrobacter sp.]